MHLHTHFSWVGAAQAFLAVVIIGTVWKLAAMHMVASGNDTLATVGKGMLFQYN